jgi:hypothetical protein
LPPTPSTIRQKPVSATVIEITPLTNGSIALTWQPVENSREYRLYSDMGSGYEVYVYKTATDQPAFIDKKLRPGATYNYRLGQVAASTGQEVALGQITANTFARENLARDTVASQVEVAPASNTGSAHRPPPRCGPAGAAQR